MEPQNLKENPTRPFFSAGFRDILAHGGTILALTEQEAKQFHLGSIFLEVSSRRKKRT